MWVPMSWAWRGSGICCGWIWPLPWPWAVRGRGCQQPHTWCAWAPSPNLSSASPSSSSATCPTRSHSYDASASSTIGITASSTIHTVEDVKRKSCKHERLWDRKLHSKIIDLYKIGTLWRRYYAWESQQYYMGGTWGYRMFSTSTN